MKTQNHRLIILAGPSCAGKSPLAKAFARFYPDLHKQMKPLILYNSRAPRPGETDGKDYYFRSREEIENLRDHDDYVVMDVRGDLQALDLKELSANLNKGEVLFEGNPFVGKALNTHPSLEPTSKVSIFMSPLSKDEIEYLKASTGIAKLKDLVTDIMRRKLLRRTRKQKGELSLKDLENIEQRASSAFKEMQDAHLFEHVIPNHDGEDHENWDAFYYPVGDARKTLLSFEAILTGKPAATEKWDADLLK